MSMVFMSLRVASLIYLSETRDPEVKRTICRACQQLLVPGITSRVRLQGTLLLARVDPQLLSALVAGRREQHIVVTCLSCGRFRRFLCRPTLLATMLRTDPQPQQQQQPQLLPPLQQQPTNAAQSSTTEAPAPPTETAPAQTGSVAPFDLSRT
eukprot:m.773358 g.773358  ORF g.773358 m.773358 type:complete len:153 (+) comp59097_c0_seq52:233-691(+)